MRFYILSIFIIMSISAQAQDKVVLVIHGGAGTILKKNMTEEKEAAYEAKLREALQAGYDALTAGKTSVQAVQSAIHVMEDSPLFNAGKGAVYTNDETQEMDASIMRGSDKQAGAVAGVSTIKNPIDAAIAVMEKSEHVMLAGKGAEEFAEKQRVTIVDSSYFKSDVRLKQLKRVQDHEKSVLDHDGDDRGEFDESENEFNVDYIEDKKFGTVGAVALDSAGNLAAGTSTGGMTNKRYHRIGDSPIIGAGTYANELVGVSCTGHGEFFIRNVVAYDVAALMEYSEMTIEEATQRVIEKQTEMGGKGGLIALDKDGNVSLPFNTAGMYRGYITENGKITIEIYDHQD
ncbi:MAG: isoaspartyl peptidase/L-asparaginase [bacterium]|nr:isoaspartyl peptidase/L-asparaginase [bacterium]